MFSSVREHNSLNLTLIYTFSFYYYYYITFFKTKNTEKNTHKKITLKYYRCLNNMMQHSPGSPILLI